MHSQQPPGVVQNWSTLHCSKQNTEQCGYDHAPVTRGRMRAQFPLPHGLHTVDPLKPPLWLHAASQYMLGINFLTTFSRSHSPWAAYGMCHTNTNALYIPYIL